VIEGNIYKSILNGKLSPTLMQNIKINYGDKEENIGEYYTFWSIKLDTTKLAKFKNQSKVSDGLWLLEKSNFK